MGDLIKGMCHTCENETNNECSNCNQFVCSECEYIHSCRTIKIE